MIHSVLAFCSCFQVSRVKAKRFSFLQILSLQVGADVSITDMVFFLSMWKILVLHVVTDLRKCKHKLKRQKNPSFNFGFTLFLSFN